MTIQDETKQYQTKVFIPQGGEMLVVAEGGKIVLDGGTIVGSSTGFTGVPQTGVARVVPADRGTWKVLAPVPVDTIVTQISVSVTQAFNGTGTDLLTVGVRDGDNNITALISDLSVAATGITQYFGGTGDLASASDIVYRYSDQNSDSSQGSANIVVQWIERG